jgi:hypothetical protein
MSDLLVSCLVLWCLCIGPVCEEGGRGESAGPAAVGSSLTGLLLGVGPSHYFMQCQGRCRAKPRADTGVTYSLPSLSTSRFGPSMPYQPLHHIFPAHSLASSQQYAHLSGQPGGSAVILSLNYHAHPAYTSRSGGPAVASSLSAPSSSNPAAASSHSARQQFGQPRNPGPARIARGTCGSVCLRGSGVLSAVAGED